MNKRKEALPDKLDTTFSAGSRAGRPKPPDEGSADWLSRTSSDEFRSAAIGLPSSASGGNNFSLLSEGLSASERNPKSSGRGRYVVFLEEAPGKGGVHRRAQGLLRSLGISEPPEATFKQLEGFALDLTENEARRLRALGGVKSVDADIRIQLDTSYHQQTGQKQPTQAAHTATQSLTRYTDRIASSGERLPYGVRAVWGGKDISGRGDVGMGTTAFVIDSGIQARLRNTRDLNFARTRSWHRSWISGETPFQDPSGHGTHVAGTIAARANGNGVVGVAPGSDVVSLKVFGRDGRGFASDIIAAIDHAASVITENSLNRSKTVINMSLGGGFFNPLDTATRRAGNKGIRFAVAAGNSGENVKNFSPAAAGNHRNVFTTSAVDNNYRMPWWSNWDVSSSQNLVDSAAPGVDVLSFRPNGGLTRKSGTSMAAPHLAGLLLMGGRRKASFVEEFYFGTADRFALGASFPGPAPRVVAAGSNDLVTGIANSRTIRGRNADPLAPVQILRGNLLLGTTRSNSNGQFAYRLTPQNIEALGQGTGKRVRARQTDSAGNTGVSPNYQFAINTTTATANRDLLTGEQSTTDRFTWSSLSDSLLYRYDTITNFERRDRLQVLGTRFRSTISKSAGRINNFTANAISNRLDRRSFAADVAAAFEVQGMNGTFIALNDSRPGFQADRDALVFLRGFDINQAANSVTII